MCANVVVSSLLMDLRPTHPRPVDVAARYRTDGTGSRAAVVVPATCRTGRHALRLRGCRLTESGGVLQVRCAACAADGEPDHSWFLSSSGPATVAEMDDAPYRASQT